MRFKLFKSGKNWIIHSTIIVGLTLTLQINHLDIPFISNSITAFATEIIEGSIPTSFIFNSEGKVADGHYYVSSGGLITGPNGTIASNANLKNWKEYSTLQLALDAGYKPSSAYQKILDSQVLNQTSQQDSITNSNSEDNSQLNSIDNSNSSLPIDSNENSITDSNTDLNQDNANTVNTISIQEARNLSTTGQTVSITGTVTSTPGAFASKAYYIQDNTGGIYVYSSFDNSLEIGSNVTVTGKLSIYNNEIEITPADTQSVVKNDNNISLIEPINYNYSDPQYGQLIINNNVTVSNIYLASSNLQFTITDNMNQSVLIYVDSKTGIDIEQLANSLDEKTIYSITGISVPYKTTPEIKIRSLQDIANLVLKETTDPIFNTVSIQDIQGIELRSALVGKKITTEGIVTYKAGSNKFYLQAPSDNNDQTSDGILVWTNANDYSKIAVGDKITVTGVIYESYISGYDDKNATDQPVTVINNTTNINIISSDNTLPKPITLIPEGQTPTNEFQRVIPEGLVAGNKNDALFFWESLEGMLVTLQNPKAVGPTNNSDIPVVSSLKNTDTNVGGIQLGQSDSDYKGIVFIEPNSTVNINAGDTFNGDITGVVYYSYGKYVILTQKNSLPEVIKGNIVPETSSLKGDDNNLTISGFNLENFSAKTANTKINTLASYIINNLNAPDILNLEEVQDDDGTLDSGNVSANATLQKLVDAIVALGGPHYNFIDIDPNNNEDGGAPGGNIRVAMIYNPERVGLYGDSTISDTNIPASWAADGHLTNKVSHLSAPAGTRNSLAVEFVFLPTQENFIVIGNHLNSKLGDTGTFGQIQPAVYPSENERIELASNINAFIQKGLSYNPDLKIIVVGDMNDYDYSKAMKVLAGDELNNIVSEYRLTNPEDTYSYIYEGQSQTIDNLLVSKNLTNYEFDMVHVNTPFYNQASDHDPILLKVNMESTRNQVNQSNTPSEINSNSSDNYQTSNDNVFNTSNSDSQQVEQSINDSNSEYIESNQNYLDSNEESNSNSINDSIDVNSNSDVSPINSNQSSLENISINNYAVTSVTLKNTSAQNNPRKLSLPKTGKYNDYNKNILISFIGLINLAVIGNRGKIRVKNKS
ncbi:MAG: KxYKxGKxW signal peptide domain-containing protein [Lactobacillaceae bacterium]|jgi:predicted extracellular nuclease|nr:KxYKxGKxW signal peptide domain-containing protein [Lactobacillaceae bacterium]